MAVEDVKPVPDRLYGRVKGKKLRPRQEWLLAEFLPRTSWPEASFAITPREIWLEVGFGGGEHAYELASKNPDVGYIAAEVFEVGICSLLSRIAPDHAEHPEPLPNLRLFTDDARPLLRGMADGSLSKLFLMFPDPWPKARHAKRRFVHPELVKEVARALRPGGEWRIASDDPTYQEWTDEVLSAQDIFTVTRRTEHPEGWPHTRYEAKAIAAGRHPVYWSLIRR
ncbi:tRNA (guanine(46)-N(7))-methyltransferase TrmB [Acidocella aromatica]|uniref:tRNA (guanine-N(7)-)-methyltransferase n=1 Tax=Acidocella aromatica TaxID=1303579 RepID=A0A840VLL9_9PROT|nr:tRNA (guanine(46)-N(7))-methyltransferase TrmB [Acidocella aromatica]MBB5372481.1 tRNA (guanine-N7-)-methyltransferase [Acidocella aromatica]